MVSGRDMNVEISLRLRPETSWTNALRRQRQLWRKDMYDLRKAFSVYLVPGIIILLMITLIVACKGKEESASSGEQNTPQDTQAKTEETRSQPPSAEEGAAGKISEQTKLPRLIDLGADKCIPCKMMAPILEELKEEYADRFEVVFIDVWKNPQKGREYGIRVIPTQIFYDANGKEFFRHVGFFSKKDILSVFHEKGINLDEK